MEKAKKVKLILEGLINNFQELHSLIDELNEKEKIKKVAVEADEPYMKEKLAKKWDVDYSPIYFSNRKTGKFYTFGKTELVEVFKPYLDNYRIIDFKDFCKQHGISNKPDYWKYKGGYCKAGSMNIQIGDIIPVQTREWDGDKVIAKGNTVICAINSTCEKYFDPATEKEYLEYLEYSKEYKKIVYAPEPWMKKILAAYWGVKSIYGNNNFDKYICHCVYPEDGVLSSKKGSNIYYDFYEFIDTLKT